MPVLVAVCTFVAVSAVAYVAAEWRADRLAVLGSLRRLHGFTGGERSQLLLDPLRARLASKAGARVATFARLLTPAGQIQRIKRKLALAGKSQRRDLDGVLARRLVGIALVPVWAVAVFRLGPVDGIAAFGLFAGLAVASVLLPEAALDRVAARRQQAIRGMLADVLDLLTISVEAGLGFEQALARVAADVDGPLADELRRVQGDVAAGASLRDAMHGLADRTSVGELRSFMFAVLQADAFGTSIATVLRAQSEEVRVRLRHAAQERAQKAPVKMLVPMVFCIFPPIFTVVLGPAVLQIARGL